jgi:hypothetical protein
MNPVSSLICRIPNPVPNSMNEDSFFFSVVFCHSSSLSYPTAFLLIINSPICIGPLVPEPAHVEDGRNAREILDGVTTLTTPAAAAAAAAAATPTAIESANQTDSSRRCNDGDNDGDRRVTVPDQAISDDRKGEDEDTDKWWTKYKRQWSGKAPVRPKADGDDDILSLNTCGHAFHSKCLASWFLIDRYDCPMCRAVYYTKRRPSLPARVASSFVPSPRLPSSSGMVMGLAAHP